MIKLIPGMQGQFVIQTMYFKKYKYELNDSNKKSKDHLNLQKKMVIKIIDTNVNGDFIFIPG